MSLKYSDVRPNIKSGDLLIWSDDSYKSLKDIFLQLVRVFTKSEYNHVGIAWVVANRVFVIEAVIPSVRIYPLSQLLPFYHVETKATWSEETEAFALEQVGEPYSVLQAVRSLFETPNLDDNWQCAELTHDILLKDGIDLGEVYTPASLVKQAINKFDSIKYIDN